MAQTETAPAFFKFNEDPKKILIEFLNTPHRFYSHEILLNRPFENLDFLGKEVVLGGKAPNWLYMHVAFVAHKKGASKISLQKVDGTLVVIFPVATNSDTLVNQWYTIEIDQNNEAILTFLRNKSSIDGFWPEDIIESSPLDLKKIASYSKSTQLTITGSGSVWMYAAAGVASSIAGYDLIVYDSPREEFLILTGEVDPGFSKVRKSRRDYPGLVIGVVGDPNSGKSIFSKVLFQVLEKYFSSTWLFDCDAASPTANWYLQMLNSGKVEEGNTLRNKTKVKWTSDLESRVSECLKSLKDNLEVVIADLPGGIHSKEKPIQRIPPGREIVMQKIDLFVILGKGGDNNIVNGWKEELKAHGLGHGIIAEINSISPDSDPSLTLERNGSVIKGQITGLDRKKGIENITCELLGAFDELIRQIKNWRIAMQALEATAKAFLTGEGGVSYGSAVRCMDDSIFTAGQYSSYNHVTNIHAEQGALASAAMAGKPDVEAIAIASTKSEVFARPCGVCRQVMLEHASRTNRDFDVVMVDSNGRYEINKVSELLPKSWESHRQGKKSGDENIIRKKPFFDVPPKGYVPGTGDQLFVDDKYIAMVWDEEFSGMESLVKLKYLCDQEKCVKTPHSFTESIRYESFLHEKRIAKCSGFGMKAAFVGKNDSYGLKAAEIINRNHFPASFVKFLDGAGIDIDKIKVSGSRGLQTQINDSDWDLIVKATPGQIMEFRKSCVDGVNSGMISIPKKSDTWLMLSRILKMAPIDIVQDRRFAETLIFEGQKVVFIFIPPDGYNSQVFNSDWIKGGRGTFAGTVIKSENAPYKRSVFMIKSFNGKEIEIISYHKTANLVKVGDKVALTGWNLYSKNFPGKQRLIQMYHSTDRIIWMQRD